MLHPSSVTASPIYCWCILYFRIYQVRCLNTVNLELSYSWVQKVLVLKRALDALKNNNNLKKISAHYGKNDLLQNINYCTWPLLKCVYLVLKCLAFVARRWRRFESVSVHFLCILPSLLHFLSFFTVYLNKATLPKNIGFQTASKFLTQNFIWDPLTQLHSKHGCSHNYEHFPKIWYLSFYLFSFHSLVPPSCANDIAHYSMISYSTEILERQTDTDCVRWTHLVWVGWWGQSKMAGLSQSGDKCRGLP